jgi:hypothetical protein
MARYRLTGPHYIHILGTEWEQVEVDLTSGKQVRKRYKVPMHLDPDKDPTCYNYPGECIVSTKASPAFPRDYIFEGPPTRDMVPLDEEGEVEIAKLVGQHPIESLPSNSQTFSDALLEKLTKQLDEISIRQGVPQASNDRVTALEQQIAELKEMLSLSMASEKLKPALSL